MIFADFHLVHIALAIAVSLVASLSIRPADPQMERVSYVPSGGSDRTDKHICHGRTEECERN